MVLFIDTSANQQGKLIAERVSGKNSCERYEYIATANMNIAHCVGCNFCWLKTPGICVFDDDYRQLLEKIYSADKIWLISETRFGFISSQAKKIVDRIMPLLTIYLTCSGPYMRHVTRYRHNPDWGVLYIGDGDKALMSDWCRRFTSNLGTNSLGVYDILQMEEAAL